MKTVQMSFTFAYYLEFDESMSPNKMFSIRVKICQILEVLKFWSEMRWKLHIGNMEAS